MRLRTFTARTMTEAMTDIRIALGDDAAIVATDAGPDGVRVTAAWEPDTSVAVRAAAPVATPGADATTDAAPDLADRLYELLAFHRVPPELADRLLTAALGTGSDDAATALGGAFDATLEFQPIRFDGGSPKPILLVGPPGQGKTLTAARLAARGVLAGHAVRVIAADTRAGAVAQITDLCRHMKIAPEPIDVIEPAAFAAGQTIIGQTIIGQTIIDAPGINPFDSDELLELRELVRRTGAEPVLVLASGCDSDDAAEIAEAFAAIGVRRLIATRLDASRRLGGILAAAACGLTLADGGIGRTVADTLVPMHSRGLARVLISTSQTISAATDCALRADHEEAA